MHARSALPLLRSPPFPGIDPKIAAVSALRKAAGSGQPNLARAVALVDAIEAAGVAGAFWDAAASPPSLQHYRSNSALAHEELIAGVAYRNPFTDAEATPEEIVALLAHWRREIRRNPGWGGKRVLAAGVAKWKQREVTQLMWAGTGSGIDFDKGIRFKGIDAVAAWPARSDADLARRVADANLPFWRIEDGFIRSVGLGAACHPPFSIVLDGSGAHYDPSGPSDLETLLATAEFPPDILARADALIALIVRSGISKYEVGNSASPLPPRTRRRILVTGQVEDDFSVLLGGGEVRTNIELLRRARSVEPDAEIWFKPHPDVDAGHRRGAVPDPDALRYADSVVRGVPMADLLQAIDGIHVLTSLAGFEALLRGVEVTTHGMPFYAGWGLTRDLGQAPTRRNRGLSLNALAAAVLLLYPKYLDPVTGLPCTPEILIRRLSDQKRPQETWLTRLRHLQGRLRRISRLMSTQ
jgi:capsular polysaccharide export protein